MIDSKTQEHRGRSTQNQEQIVCVCVKKMGSSKWNTTCKQEVEVFIQTRTRNRALKACLELNPSKKQEHVNED